MQRVFASGALLSAPPSLLSCDVSRSFWPSEETQTNIACVVLFTGEASTEPAPLAPRSLKLKQEAGGAAAGASRAADYRGNPSGLRDYPRCHEHIGPLR